MTENNSNNVRATFEKLLEKIETEVDIVDQAGVEAFEGKDYDGIRDALHYSDQIRAFRDRVMALCDDWEKLERVQTSGSAGEEETSATEQGSPGRLPGGVRTPEQVFYRPILKVLKDLGGSAQASDVLGKLEPAMRDVLREADYEPLPSGEICWRKTANFAHDTMARRNLLKPNSPRGIWEMGEYAHLYLPREID